MKTKNIIRIVHLSIAVLLLFTACDKSEAIYLTNSKKHTVTLTGYNGSNQVLEAKLDTFLLANELAPKKSFLVSGIYSFLDNKQAVALTIKEKNTGKMVLEKELSMNDKMTKMNLLYHDGKLMDMPTVPAVEENKIKITYMFSPTITKYTEPVDIVIGKYYLTPKVFEEFARLKNVKPNQFSETITFPTIDVSGQQVYNGQKTFMLFRAYIYKAGTNEFYTDGSAYFCTFLNSSVPIPALKTAVSKLYIFSEEPADDMMRFTKNIEL